LGISTKLQVCEDIIYNQQAQGRPTSGPCWHVVHNISQSTPANARHALLHPVSH
jgi:hypothetical protein